MLALCAVLSVEAKDYKTTEQSAQTTNKKEIVKTGYNFGPLPAVAFDADKGFQLGESVQYTVWVKSDVPVCACFGRLDVRQNNMAYYSVEGYSF